MNAWITFLAISLVAAIGEVRGESSHPAQVQSSPSPEKRLISAAEAILMAKETYGGEVLSAELVNPPGGQPYYRIKMISDGNVRIIQIQAVQGR